MENTFITPEGHKGFLTKKLFNEMGRIQWGAIAYILENGGGPENNHTHSDNHIFIVVDGETAFTGGVNLATGRSSPERISRSLWTA